MKAKGSSKEQVGVVLRKSMAKTAVIRLERLVRHPILEKRTIRTKKVYAHDEHDTVQPGDTVLIKEIRPLSKMKRWKVVKVIQRSTVEIAV